jgi:hypothetical protein
MREHLGFNLFIVIMRFAVGFFGFVRKMPTSDDVEKIISLFPAFSDVDIFISVPTVMDEYLNINTLVDQNTLTHIWGDRLKVSNFFEYDPHKHIRKAREMGVPDHNAKYDIHSFRQLSLMYSISTLSKIVKDYAGDYDNIILTRFDLLDRIHFVRKVFNEPNTKSIYGWREAQPTAFEDRIIITCIRGIEILSDMYDTFDPSLIDASEGLIPEFYMGNYLNLFPELCKEIQRSVRIEIIHEWSYGSQGKQSENFKKYVNSILDSHPIKNTF